jgi:lysozyme
MERDLLQELADFICPFEGCHKVGKDGLVYPYICPTGHPTQGYGILVKDMNVPPITKEEALKRFKLVAPQYISSALKYSPNLVSDTTRLIASFIYNLGPTAYAGSTLRKKINAGDWVAAQREILKWNKGRNPKTGLLEPLRGLTHRRSAEGALLLES